MVYEEIFSEIKTILVEFQVDLLKVKVQEALDGLRKASEGTENVVPHVVNAVRAYASVGEICDVWRDVFGEWEEPKIF